MDKEKEKEEYGRDLQENNVRIVHCLVELKAQREELMFLIDKLREEKQKLEMEMERLTYKLCLINKSTAQRLRAKQNYDVTIAEIEEKYNKLKENSGDLLKMLGKDCDQLDSMFNKKTSTEGIEQMERLPSPIEIPPKDEECLCLANKDGRCIREKMASKMVQAVPETEFPVKLEKEPNKVTQTDVDSVVISDRGAQTLVTGDTDMTEEDTDSNIEEQKAKLNRAAVVYKEASLHMTN